MICLFSHRDTKFHTIYLVKMMAALTYLQYSLTSADNVIHRHTNTHMYAHTLHRQTNRQIHRCTHIHTYTTCMHLQTHVCKYTHMHTRTHNFKRYCNTLYYLIILFTIIVESRLLPQISILIMHYTYLVILD